MPLQVFAGPSTANFDASIQLATSQTDYYGGEIFSIYNNIAVSGNVTVLDEGSYTVIYLSKDKFQKPRPTDVFDRFKSLDIVETATEYQIITTYQQLAGGYNGGTPVKLNLLQGQTVNLSQHRIKQKFFDKDGNELTPESSITVGGKAVIDTLMSSSENPVKLYSSTGDLTIDSTYTIKPGSHMVFEPYSLNIGYLDFSDPRDRRVYVSIPAGTIPVAGSGWTLDPTVGQYYKDITRDDLRRYEKPLLSIDLDFSGIDMSSHDAMNRSKSFSAQWSIQPVVGGVVQNDLGPNTGNLRRSFYVEWNTSLAGNIVWMTSRYVKTILDDYTLHAQTYTGLNQYSNETMLTSDPTAYNHQRIRYMHNNVSEWRLDNSSSNPSQRQLLIRSSRIDVDVDYLRPAEYRILLTGLNSTEIAQLETKLSGTKVYGLKADGTKVLLINNASIASYPTTSGNRKLADNYTLTFDNQAWMSISASEEYVSVVFEYPNGGILLSGEDEIQQYYRSISTEVIADIKETTYQ